MSTAHDRRALNTARIPFDAMVEVGGSLGPSFEAQAVNLSGDGMSLRTAYLPEIGQPVMCRFDAGGGMIVVAAGEVLWKDDTGNGGEFGIRFTNLDAASSAALERILAAEEGMPVVEPGRKVRLHIDGLASPMRARVRDQLSNGVTAYSELGFLQMGKPLDLEDAQSGQRRPASIDRVEIAMDQASKIPQLVVSLRYDDMVAGEDESGLTPPDRALEIPAEEMAVGSDAELAPAPMPSIPPAPMPMSMTDEPAAEARHPFDGDGEEEGGLKRSFKEGAAKVGPAIMGIASRAKTAAALLAAKARRKGEAPAEEIPLRRTTAPAPGGGLHAAGRKVVRGSITDGFVTEEEAKPAESGGKLKLTKKKIGLAASVVVALLLVGIALKKPAQPVAVATPAPTDSVAALPAPAPEPAPAPKPVAPPVDPLAAQAAAMAANPGPRGKATPFTNGSVGSHPNVIKIKMDGPVEGIQGAAQPTGFTVVIPNRKSIEPTATLADKDGRISSVNVMNEPTGAELSVSFKDGVPNYAVRAKGDTLELVLAKQSAHGDNAEAHAPSTKKSTHRKKR